MLTSRCAVSKQNAARRISCVSIACRSTVLLLAACCFSLF
jgi:hypothetical protein